MFEGFLHQLAGEMDFRDCHADAGGGMYVERDVILDSTISFSRCHAYRSDSGGWCSTACFELREVWGTSL